MNMTNHNIDYSHTTYYYGVKNEDVLSIIASLLSFEV